MNYQKNKTAQLAPHSVSNIDVQDSIPLSPIVIIKNKSVSFDTLRQ